MRIHALDRALLGRLIGLDGNDRIFENIPRLTGSQACGTRARTLLLVSRTTLVKLGATRSVASRGSACPRLERGCHVSHLPPYDRPARWYLHLCQSDRRPA